MTSPPLIEQTRELIAKRDTVDARLNALQTILKEQNTDMTESLVDEENYPRADLDVYLIRHTRTEIITLRTDYKTLSDQIHLSMQGLHGEGRVIAPVLSVEYPFMTVENVAAESPSFGVLQKNDRIVQWGRIKKGTSGTDSKMLMEGVAQTVANSENVFVGLFNMCTDDDSSSVD